MSFFWMGLAPIAVIIVSFVLILGITKGVTYVTESSKRDTVPSTWVTRQVYSGDDSLGHPDLKKISELQSDGPVEKSEKTV